MAQFIEANQIRIAQLIGENHKTNSTHIWKYVSQLRKKDADLVQMELHRTSLTTPCEIADGFSKHFQSVPSSHFSEAFSSDSSFVDVITFSFHFRL
jgi:hypothetical protein